MSSGVCAIDGLRAVCPGGSRHRAQGAGWLRANVGGGRGVAVSALRISRKPYATPGDQTLRLVSKVIQMMLRGEIPEDIRP